MPDGADAAVIQLKTPVNLISPQEIAAGTELDGNAGGWTELHGGDKVALSGASLFHSGYGKNAYNGGCADANGTGAGTLRSATYSSGTGSTVTNGGNALTNTTNNANQNAAHGDSGSAVLVNSSNGGHISDWRIAGVASAVDPSCTNLGDIDGDGNANFTFESLRSANAHSIRGFVHNVLSGADARLPRHNFSSCGSELSYYWPSTAAAPNWTCNSGWLHSSANTGHFVGSTTYQGAEVLRMYDPRSVTQVRTRVWSTDNDGAGLIARWRNSGNYYYFMVDPQNSRAQVVKMQNGSVTVLAESSFTAFSTWGGTWHTLDFHASGAHFVGAVDGVEVVKATDTSNDPFTGGYYGLFSAFQDNIYFDWIDHPGVFHSNQFNQALALAP